MINAYGKATQHSVRLHLELKLLSLKFGGGHKSEQFVNVFQRRTLLQFLEGLKSPHISIGGEGAELSRLIFKKIAIYGLKRFFTM